MNLLNAFFNTGWQPQGIELAAPHLRDDIIREACRKQAWSAPPIVVTGPDFLTNDEARSILDVGPGTLGELCGRGILQMCYRAEDAMFGVTAVSVSAEVTWKREAGMRARIWRSVGGVLHYV